MKTEVVSITHSNEGIRVAWPDGRVNVFSNPVYLAEAYARSERVKESVRQELITTVAQKLNRLCDVLKDEAAPEAELSDLRNSLLELSQVLA